MNFIPYGKQTINDKDVEEVVKILKSDFLTTGPKIKEFEDKIANYCGAKYCVSVSNGTAALHLSSLVLLETNDKVITTPNSFLATSNSILYASANPVFVDICDDGNINLDLCEKELIKDPSIKAIYVVHFSGNPINQNKLKYLKDTFNIKILEDCSHSIGSIFQEVKSGSCLNSDVSTFSFHPVKLITTGEGGAITTNCKIIYEKLLNLRSHGMNQRPDIAPWYYEMKELGFNYRLTDISCALGLSQIKKLDSFLYLRRSIAKRYDEFFSRINFIKPLYSFTNNSAYHLYVVKIDFKRLLINKKDFVLKIREEGIGLQLHYIPINKQSYYMKLGYGDENTPVMDDYYENAISLPIYPNLTQEEQAYVCEMILEICND